MKGKDNMKRLLYDATILRFGLQSGAARSGIFVVASEVLREFVRRDDLEVSLYAEEGAIPDVRAYLNSCPEFRRLEIANGAPVAELVDFVKRLEGYVPDFAARRTARLLWWLYRLPRSFLLRIAKAAIRWKQWRHPISIGNRFDCFFSPMYSASPDIRRSSLPRFTILYDTIPQVLPELYVGNDGVKWTQEVINGLTESDWCFSISECTKRDFLRFSPRLKSEQVVTIPLAASGRRFHPCSNLTVVSDVLSKYGIRSDMPYFLSLCTLDPRKNLSFTLRAFVKFAEKESSAQIVLVGGGRGCDPKIEETLEAISPEMRRRIVLTGYVPDEDLAPLYSGARAFVYLSLYEGFGLPPLEAMMCGTPVLTSDTSSLPEVVGDAAIVVSPHDLDAASEALDRLFRDARLRESLCHKGKLRAGLFSWEKAVDIMLDTINAALRSMR